MPSVSPIQQFVILVYLVIDECATLLITSLYFVDPAGIGIDIHAPGPYGSCETVLFVAVSEVEISDKLLALVLVKAVADCEEIANPLGARPGRVGFINRVACGVPIGVASLTYVRINGQELAGDRVVVAVYEIEQAVRVGICAREAERSVG